MFKGAPLAGATVTAFITNTNSVFGVTTTGASGNYSFIGVPTGWNATPNLQFWATKAGYAFVPSLGPLGSASRAG